jgi:hypothetical protein
MPRTKLVEALIDMVVEGQAPEHVLQIPLAGSVDRMHGINVPIEIGKQLKAGESIRTYFDSYGSLRFCSLSDDVLINPASDSRLQELMQYADALSVDSPLFDLFESFEGTLEDLYQQVTDGFSLAGMME